MSPPRHNLMIDIDGVSLAVDRVGQGPPVVCLHSVGHDSRDYDGLVERCGDLFEFIRLDWPGHGGSAPDRLPASAERYAALADGVLSGIGVERPLVIGNSIGGAAAITLASRRILRGLVLCDSGGLVAVDATVRAFCGMFERFFAAADAFVLPTRFDIFGQVVLEAMAFSVPIVSTDVHGIPEMARADQEALLVPAGDPSALADAMARVLADTNLSTRLATAARARVVANYDAAQLLPHHAGLAAAVGSLPA